MILARGLKILHEVGAVGTAGSLAACLVLLTAAPSQPPVAYAAVLGAVASLTRYLLIPSLALVLVSGLLAMAATPAYKNAAWAWVKALLGIGTFEGSLVTVGASARDAATLAAQGASGSGNPLELARVLHTEWGGLCILMVLAAINIVLAVWRPRIFPKTDAPQPTP